MEIFIDEAEKREEKQWSGTDSSHKNLETEALPVD